MKKAESGDVRLPRPERAPPPPPPPGVLLLLLRADTAAVACDVALAAVAAEPECSRAEALPRAPEPPGFPASEARESPPLSTSPWVLSTAMEETYPDMSIAS